VIAAGGRDQARGRDPAGEQVGEGPARLEGAGVLEELELQGERKGGEPEAAPLTSTTGVTRT
jgi:hypothetical protein